MFDNLDILSQSKVLIQILNLFSCNAEKANLTAISGASGAGGVKFQNTILSEDNVTIIYKSPTGVFTKEVCINAL